jgi:hypothetical protein
MKTASITTKLRALIALGALGLFALVAGASARASSTPVGPLPAGPVTSTTTTRGQLIAVALPHVRQSSGYVWRIARRYNASVVRQISEADVGNTVVLVFKAVGRGNTSLVFALTRGDASPRATRSYTQKVLVR